MTVDLQSAIVINRPVSQVSRYAADPDNAPLLKKRLEGIDA